MQEDEIEDNGGGENDRGCVTKVLCNRTSLFILMTGYALLGAFVFKTLEGGQEAIVPVQVQKSREDCLRELWLITERLNVLYEKNWTKLVTEQLKRFERAVVESGRIEGIPTPGSPHWSFGGALLYSLTLLTTIGYGRLSPRTALGKIVAIFYAFIGVPLMLVLLSALGSLLAGGARRGYSKLCCKNSTSTSHLNPVGYYKAATNHTCKSAHDECSIQINTQNHNCYKPVHTTDHHSEYQEPPKKTILATVRSSHSRGRCRQIQVRQMLAEPHMCPAHSHIQPLRNKTGIMVSSDIEETEESEENDHGICSHDTPSRVPLICRKVEEGRSQSPARIPAPPTVPATLVLFIFIGYICLGAAVFSTTSDWNFLDAIYFCFIALTTIGLGDALPQNPEFNAQIQLFACCLYLFFGLVVVAMCFSLVQEEVAVKCKQFASYIGLVKR